MPSREATIAAIESGIMRWQDATQAFDEAVGERYRLNPAERRALSVVVQQPRPSGEVARLVGLKPPSVTALVDRLEKRGFVRREPDPEDRRKTLIAATAKTRAMAEECYMPLARAGRELFTRYTEDDLALILDLLSRVTEIQEAALGAMSAGSPDDIG
jgi:DNA-binding MarR family transcriptional regulator